MTRASREAGNGALSYEATTGPTHAGGSHEVHAAHDEHGMPSDACISSHDNHTVKQEFWALFKLAGPTIVQTASQQVGLTARTIICVRHAASEAWMHHAIPSQGFCGVLCP